MLKLLKHRNIKLIIVLYGIMTYSLGHLYAQTSYAISGYSWNDNSSYLGNDVLYPPAEYLDDYGNDQELYKLSLRNTAPISRISSVSNMMGTCPLVGTVHIPVLLIKFSDSPATITQSAMNSSFNSPDYLGGVGISVNKYYVKQSYSMLNIVFDVYDWIQAPQTYAYYANGVGHEFQLGIDTINAFNSSVNFSQYDNDNNGRIDGFVVVYAGIANGTTGIWPNTRILRQYNSNPVDGKYLGNISLIPEKGTRNLGFEITVTAHEFAHIMGLPDLYYNSPTGSGNGPLRGLTMMDFSDSNCLVKPINLDAWSKYFLGWVAPQVITITSSKYVSLRSANDYPDMVSLHNGNLNPREFFLIENRYRSSDNSNLDKGMFEGISSSYGGLAIYHVDEAKIEADYLNNYVQYDSDGDWWNDTISHPGLFYEQNTITSTSYSERYATYMDLYWSGSIAGYVFSFFDETPHTFNAMPRDMTSSSYSGISDTLVRFLALSPMNQPTMQVKVCVADESPNPWVSNEGIEPLFEPEYIQLGSPIPDTAIYYSLDGTDPSESNGLLYSTGILIDTSCTLKFIAYSPGMMVSDVTECNYSFQTLQTPISVSITQSAEVLFLAWQSVEWANGYQIYKSDISNPVDWGDPIGLTSITNWSEPISQRAFYRITAIRESGISLPLKLSR